MIHVNKRATNLYKGYQEISQAENVLRSTWRPDLLATYTRQLRIYEKSKTRYENNKPIVSGLGGLGTAVTLMTAIFALILPGLPLNFRLSLVALAFLLSITFVLVWRFYMRNGFIEQPPHPLNGSINEQLFPQLFGDWQAKLQIDFNFHWRNLGDDGERDFIWQLMKTFDHRTYLLHQIQQRPNSQSDVDIILVGPKGIWLFEVIDWDGKITGRNSDWEWIRLDKKEPENIKETPVTEWSQMVTDLQETLRRRVPNLRPDLLIIHGGVVFGSSKKPPQIDIGACCQGAWGTPQIWGERMMLAEEIPNLSAGEVFQIIDALLECHQQLTGIDRNTFSMNAYASRLIRDAEDRLYHYSNSA